MPSPTPHQQHTMRTSRYHTRAHRKYIAADQSSLGLGYDFGAQNAFVSVAGETDVNNKPITARGTWFQKGNSIRAEADVKLDSRQKLWGT